MSRFILHRLSEEFGVKASLAPKPVAGDWHGSGCLTDVSTKAMRQPGGIKEIENAIGKLAKRHQNHIAAYDPNHGKDNALRLIGIFCTSPIDEFSSGVDTLQVSVRIPLLTVVQDFSRTNDPVPIVIHMLLWKLC